MMILFTEIVAVLAIIVACLVCVRDHIRFRKQFSAFEKKVEQFKALLELKEAMKKWE